jgi:phosphatidylinositol glycan class B
MSSTTQNSNAKRPERQVSLPDPAANDKLLNDQTRKDIWNLLLLLRFANALCLRTFFQPDEYFQSLEPAWQMVFGAKSGAWITWVSVSP